VIVRRPVGLSTFCFNYDLHHRCGCQQSAAMVSHSRMQFASLADMHFVFRSALANLIITYIHLYRAQYSTGRQSWLSNESNLCCRNIGPEIYQLIN